MVVILIQRREYLALAVKAAAFLSRIIGTQEAVEAVDTMVEEEGHLMWPPAAAAPASSPA